MVRTTERVIEILRRTGPGVLPASRLKQELRRQRPPIELSRDVLRRLSARSDGRLLLLEVTLEPCDAEGMPRVLEGWVMLMDSRDAPDYSRLAQSLWATLAALAQGIDPGSRVDVCRWVIMAENARKLCAIEGPGSPSIYDTSPALP